VPVLLAAGHEVTGTTRVSERAGAIAGAGATPVLVDVFDAAALARAVAEAKPDAVVNQLTALPQAPSPRGIKAAYAANDRARGEGGRNLLAAARAAGVERYVTQSVAFFYRPTGRPGLRDEETPLWTDAPGLIGAAARVVEQTEREALAAGGVVLRYGFFGGPGTWYDPDGAVGERVRKRRYPLVGDGAGVHSFVHVDDAAAATVAALDAPSGAYNVVDDHPAPTSEWLPAFAAALGAPPPRKLPELPLKLLGGRALVAWQEGLEGASNARAKSVIGWTGVHPTWRTGFRDP
jgi:nucleoside-diphosphate-sugar epimerase